MELPLKLESSIKHRPLKRAFDLIFSLVMLILCMPLFISSALIIRLTSEGKVIFFQQRIGRNGLPFRCYKFRTMYVDAEERLKELLKDSKNYDEWKSSHKLKNDPRITPFGSFLRKTSLDEIPQFWNVLKGDLSVVGPRPVVKEEIVNHYGPIAPKILSIRPGITGIWQVFGRSDTSYRMRVSLDEQYVDNLSFILDLKLIAFTIPIIFSRKGAY